MPLLETIGSASAKGFGFAKRANVAGFISNVTTSQTTYYAQDICTDGSGNYYIVGYVTTAYHAFILKINSSGQFQWAYTIAGVFANNGSCDFYNGNIYWQMDNAVYVVPTAGATSVTKYTYTGSGTRSGVLRFDSSGNFYSFGFGYDSTGTYHGLTVAKYSSTGTALANYAYYYTPATGTSNGDDARFSSFNKTTNTIAYCGSYLTPSPYESFLYVWVSGAVTIAKSIPSYAGCAVCTDNSGNVYVIANDGATANTVYLLAFNSSGTLLYQKTLSGAGAIVRSNSNGLTCDNLGSLYFTNANSGNSKIIKITASTGNVVWAKNYSTYTTPYSFGSTFYSSGLVVGAGAYFGASAPALAVPASTGGANGTYASCVVSTVSPSVTTPALSPSTIFPSSWTPTASNMTSSTATLTSTTTIVSVTSSAVIPV